MLMRLFLTALLAGAALPVLSGPASAQGRTADWVDVAIDRVIPDSDGGCQVSGWVVTVRDGARYQPGSAIDFEAPCDREGLSQAIDADEMAARGGSLKASVQLDSGGRVLDWAVIQSQTDGIDTGVRTDTRMGPPANGSYPEPVIDDDEPYPDEMDMPPSPDDPADDLPDDDGGKDEPYA
jgi:hypothetical protein